MSRSRLLAPLLLLAAGLVLALPAAAWAGSCPNEVLRTGWSARLPDCRAYELVTPRELGRTGDMTFEHNEDHALVSGDGEHLALNAQHVYFEPGVSVAGTTAVFSRTLAGWSMQSAATAAIAAERLEPQLLSPDFSQIALRSARPRDPAPFNLVFGPVGGPYSTLSISSAFSGHPTANLFVGANAGVSGVAAFSHVFFISQDRALLRPGPEREAAEETEPGYPDLYEWGEGRLRLVNVAGDGRLLNPCGATLGGGAQEGASINAVSADGSRVLFKSPSESQLPGCPEPQLYMRVNGMETVDVSEPEGVSVPLAQRSAVRFDGASADGSKVYFTTGTALTPEAGAGYHLYEYDLAAPSEHRLTLVASEVVNDTNGESDLNPGFVVSADGSVVYYGAAGGIYRYDAQTGAKRFVAVPSNPIAVEEPWYVTPGGGFLVFAAGQPGGPAVEFEGPHGREKELRGAGHDELYRYDAAGGSVMCVSCGAGVAPAKGEMLEPEATNGLLFTPDTSRGAVSISEDGRRAFFQTGAQLVPQDTNEDSPEQPDTELSNGADVYEWEADGTEEAPGAFCGVANGCTRLISAGEAVGPERFLGASASGNDLFFSSAAQLLPQATPEFTNIYDARVDGGFPPPPASVECTSCQGVGNPPPQFNTPASATFTGAGSPSLPPARTPTTPPTRSAGPTRAQKLDTALRACHKDRNGTRRRRCEAKARAKYARRRTK
jgi:hypothetical protein